MEEETAHVDTERKDSPMRSNKIPKKKSKTLEDKVNNKDLKVRLQASNKWKRRLPSISLIVQMEIVLWTLDV